MINNKKKLFRSSQDKILAGICGGLGEYFDVDPVFIRLLTVALTVLTGGTMIVAYIVGIFIIPKQTNQQ